MWWAAETMLLCNGCSHSLTKKSTCTALLWYLESDSLTFPHPCVLHDRVLLSIHEKLWTESFTKQDLSQNGAIFVSWKSLHTNSHTHSNVLDFLVVHMLAKRRNWNNRHIFGQSFWNFDSRLFFGCASVIFSDKTVHTNFLCYLVVGFSFNWLTVVESCLWNNR